MGNYTGGLRICWHSETVEKSGSIVFRLRLLSDLCECNGNLEKYILPRTARLMKWKISAAEHGAERVFLFLRHIRGIVFTALRPLYISERRKLLEVSGAVGFLIAFPESYR